MTAIDSVMHMYLNVLNVLNSRTLPEDLLCSFKMFRTFPGLSLIFKISGFSCVSKTHGKPVLYPSTVQDIIGQLVTAIEFRNEHMSTVPSYPAFSLAGNG